jgi:signal transduction histidine kinase
MQAAVSPDSYQETLAEYLHTHGEAALYRASLLSQSFIESGLGPEDIIALHVEALDYCVDTLPPREQARAMGDAHQFLLEIMIAYGIRYREYMEMRITEGMRDDAARAELAHERALDQERFERERDDLLATIAHELRSPITAAMGNLAMAERSLSRGQTDPVPRLLDSTRDALNRLSRLTADLVELSRGEMPRLEQLPQPIGELVVQTCDWARSAAEDQGVSLNYTVEQQDVRVLGDADALLSVFANLVSNAIRYTHEGGRVEVRSGADGAFARVEVEDTGIGIPHDVQDRVFEKFFRGAEARAVEAKGLGLGLALVKQLVDAHQGRVEFQSTPGVGSTFRVLLPLMANETQEDRRNDSV